MKKHTFSAKKAKRDSENLDFSITLFMNNPLIEVLLSCIVSIQLHLKNHNVLQNRTIFNLKTTKHSTCNVNFKITD